MGLLNVNGRFDHDLLIIVGCEQVLGAATLLEAATCMQLVTWLALKMTV